MPGNFPFRHNFRHYLILLIVPVISFLVIGSGLLNTRVAFIYGGDPMYAYLLNGLNLAQLNADIGHTDNPGTTVQVFSAVIVRTVYAFSDANNINDDVIANPEKYLFAGRLVQICLITLALYWLGSKTYRWSNGNIIAAVFVQNCVLVGPHAVLHAHSFAPEGFLVIGGILMLALCLRILHYPNDREKLPVRFAIFFGIICAFVTVTKLPALVYVFIPLLVLKGWRHRLIFAGSFLVSAFVFVLPAINRIGSMFDFAFKVATHSGIYGSGEEKIIDSGAFVQHLSQHVAEDYVLFALVLASIPVLIRGILKIRKWSPEYSLRYRMLSGLIMTIVANVILASKHYSLHYLIPSQVLLVLVAWLLYGFYAEKIKWPAGPWINRVAILFFCLVIPFTLYARYRERAVYTPGFVQAGIAGNNILFDAKRLPRIYVTPHAGGAGPEPALYFGCVYSGHSGIQNAMLVRKYYPGVILYDYNANRFHDFSNPVPPELIVSKYPELWFYAALDSLRGAAQRDLFLALRDSSGPLVTFTKYYREASGAEEIYLMQCDTARGRKLFQKTREFVIDFETMKNDTSFASTDTAIVMYSRPARSLAQAFSGKHALYFEHANVYSGIFKLPVVPGAVYEITAWKYGEPLTTWIAARSGPNLEYYQSSAALTGENRNGWREIMLRMVIPRDFPFPFLEVFVYNDDDREMWIDDVRVKEYNGELQPSTGQ